MFSLSAIYGRRLVIQTAEKKIEFLMAIEEMYGSDLMDFLKSDVNSISESEALFVKLSRMGIKNQSQLVNLEENDLKSKTFGLSLSERWALSKALDNIRVSELTASR